MCSSLGPINAARGMSFEDWPGWGHMHPVVAKAAG